MSMFQRGDIRSPSEVYRFLQHVMQYNINAVKDDMEKLVACVWGHAGISKTSVIKQMETIGVMIDGKRVFPKVHHVALAQIEEAGDITGFPELKQRAVGEDKNGNVIYESYMSYEPPPWWPTDHVNHNILLFDDFNRTDPRILKSIMQLLQDYRTNVTDLPLTTHIMLTGNPPDEGDYMVNEIDKAILTRMVHISMKFDKIDWATWAKGNKVDERVISFVLAHPELCDGLSGTRTNPRSIVQFARLIKPLANLKEEADLLHQLGYSAMDEEVVLAFEKFALGDYQYLVDPEELLNKYEQSIEKINGLKKGLHGHPREDLIGIICDRLFVYLMQRDLTLNTSQRNNFISFIKRTDIMPRDLMYSLLRRLRFESTIGGDERHLTFVADLVNEGGDEVADLLMDVQ